MRVFFDSEFTALTQSARLLSLALVDENGRTFYAECIEAKTYTLDPWLQQHVLPHMQWLTQPDSQATFRHDAHSTAQQSTWVFDTEPHIATALTEWLSVYNDIEMWLIARHTIGCYFANCLAVHCTCPPR